MSRIGQIRELLASQETPEGLAEEFCELNDDAQARFFVHIARIAASWGCNAHGLDSAYWQATAIGRHLRTCSCSTEEARAFISNIASAMVDPGGGR